MHVAYYFIYEDIPATNYAEKLNREDSTINRFNRNEYRKFRLKHKRRFEMEICLKRNPFHALTSHIMNLRETYLLENMNENKLNIKGSKNSEKNENEAS